MKTPPKKAAKPKAKLGRTASDTRRTGITASADGLAGRGAKDAAPDLRDFETQACIDIRLPTDAHVIGEPVTVTAVRNPGLPHVGLLVTCRRGEHTYEVGLADVVFAAGSPAAQFVSEYRAWLGLPSASAQRAAARRPHKAASEDIVVGKPVDLVVLACKSNALRCRLLGSSREVTLRTAVRDEVPGAIITVTPTKEWTHARHPYISGTIGATRFDVSALGLTPLAVHAQGDWDPDDAYWGEEDESVEDWAKPIIARGKRPMFEFEQVIPGADPDNYDSDPILEAAELRVAGDERGAHDLLMKLLAKDLRCLDAHAHLGNLAFERNPKQALRHYEMGTAIGGASLGKDFDGVLAWGLIDNRPYMRCLHGVGLCAWRLGDMRRAKAVFTKMLWLNPSDNQGARFNLAAVEAGKTWEEMEAEEA
ncbi:MAG: hypothetical protein RL385_3224 [Pseudomonadota bacterium]|jgi:hypothetical protein